MISFISRAAQSRTPLSMDQIRKRAPAAFAESAHESRSNRYLHVPTYKAIDALGRVGFHCVHAEQSRTRRPGHEPFTRHLLRFAIPNAPVPKNRGDISHELILLNSHNGTSSYHVMLGAFRMVCANGLVVPQSIAEQVKVRHSAKYLDEIVEGTTSLVEKAHDVAASVDLMRSVTLDRAEQAMFASQALALRWNPEEGSAPIEPRQLLEPRRQEDQGNDVWTMFNRVQENLIRGGQLGRNASGKRTTTRAVNGIDESNRINTMLWAFSQGVARLKA